MLIYNSLCLISIEAMIIWKWCSVITVTQLACVLRRPAYYYCLISMINIYNTCYFMHRCKLCNTQQHFSLMLLGWHAKMAASFRNYTQSGQIILNLASTQVSFRQESFVGSAPANRKKLMKFSCSVSGLVGNARSKHCQCLEALNTRSRRG